MKKLAGAFAVAMILAGCATPAIVEEETVTITALDDDSQTHLEKIGDSLFTAINAHDFSMARELMTDEFNKNPDAEKEFLAFCKRLDGLGSFKTIELVTTMNLPPARVLIYKCTMSIDAARPGTDEIQTLEYDILFSMMMADIDGKVVVVGFKPLDTSIK